MKKLFMAGLALLIQAYGFSWGFYAHQLINTQAVFLLPPEMMVLYKPQIAFLSAHATDPDSRRYLVAAEGPRHFIDLDKYGHYPFETLPRKWKEAVEKFGADSLQAHGIVPWWIQTMLAQLTRAFEARNRSAVLKCAAELGHYIADAHVPLHTCSNHNGQKTNQHGIHGFWESRIPELFAETDWDLLTGKGKYLENPLGFTWTFILESAAASDSVLYFERKLNSSFPAQKKYAFEPRNGALLKQYSQEYAAAYHQMLNGMVERRLKASIHAVACFWITAWVNAGQPDLQQLTDTPFSETERKEMEQLQQNWKIPMIGKSCG